MKTRRYIGGRESSTAATAFPPPEHIIWPETGDNANQACVKSRRDALKHRGLQIKSLQKWLALAPYL